MDRFEPYVCIAAKTKGRKLRIEGARGTFLLFENTGGAVVMYAGDKPVVTYRRHGEEFTAEINSPCFYKCMSGCGDTDKCVELCTARCAGED